MSGKNKNTVNIRADFNRKPILSNGLVVTVSNSRPQVPTRLVASYFNNFGNIIIMLDNRGAIFTLDLHYKKLKKIAQCINITFIKVSILDDDEIFVGTSTGTIKQINFLTEIVIDELTGHENAVIDMSFLRTKSWALSYSKKEAIIWDLKYKIRVCHMLIEPENEIQFITFLPLSPIIIGCLSDYRLYVWLHHDREGELHSEQYEFARIKKASFSGNGSVLLLTCDLPYLIYLDAYTLEQIKVVPLRLHGIKDAMFLQQNFDGGNNKIVALLSQKGVLHFFNSDRNSFLEYKLSDECEIKKFDCSKIRGCLLTVALSNGDIKVYTITRFLNPSKCVPKVDRFAFRHAVEHELPSTEARIIGSLKKGDVKRIRLYDQYPDEYRLIIWALLLKLPLNREYYAAVIDSDLSAITIEKSRPIELISNLSYRRNLIRLLKNLKNWNPFFAQVGFLPSLVFPFAKVFLHKPLVCFEAVATIIMNWCQYWFEFMPLPPLNILAIIENNLMCLDPALMKYYTENQIGPEVYAWPILSTMFSEVLLSKNWLILFDHVLTNDPTYLLIAVIAYNLIQKELIFRTDKKALKAFFCFPNPISVKTLIKKTYRIFANTNLPYHPCRYLKPFKPFDKGYYTEFYNYPKCILRTQLLDEFQLREQEKLYSETKHLENMKKLHEELLHTVATKYNHNKIHKLIEETIEVKLKQRQDEIFHVLQQRNKIQKELYEYQKYFFGYLLEQQNLKAVKSGGEPLTRKRKNNAINLVFEKIVDIEDLTNACIKSSINAINEFIEKLREELNMCDNNFDFDRILTQGAEMIDVTQKMLEVINDFKNSRTKFYE